MQTKDFRIGNLLNHKRNGITTVKSLHEWEDGSFSINEFYENDFTPIQLTESFFIDNGEKDKNGDYFIWYRKEYGLRFYPIIDENKNVISIQIVKYDHAPISQYDHVKHVHTFQNLYFALKGEEINL